MFDKKRYVTNGIQGTLGLGLQIYLWDLIDEMEGEKDYLQVFELHKVTEDEIEIIHRQEEPEYRKELKVNDNIEDDYIKVYIIDDGDYSTMLLACEY